MVPDLFRLLNQNIDDEIVAMLASRLSERACNTKSALGYAGASVIAALAELGKTLKGAVIAVGLISECENEPDNQKNGKDVVAPGSSVGKLVSETLFGERQRDVVKLISTSCDIRASSVETLLMFMASAAIRLVGREMRQSGVRDAASVGRILAAQKDFYNGGFAISIVRMLNAGTKPVSNLRMFPMIAAVTLLLPRLSAR